jgi:hypothetical protein
MIVKGNNPNKQSGESLLIHVLASARISHFCEDYSQRSNGPSNSAKRQTTGQGAQSGQNDFKRLS